MPHESLLIIQTDALLIRPLDPFFFQFPYLGAPFLPRQHSEYFEKRRSDGRISGFFKTDTPIHGSPNPDVYPHLNGNGGLSIRQRNVMLAICERWGSSSPAEELEDVFFSRHVARSPQCRHWKSPRPLPAKRPTTHLRLAAMPAGNFSAAQI